jgi:Uma2 family endonuclease
MTEPARQPSHTFAEYLALETKSDARHELVNGEILAMSGGTPEHSRLAASVIRELGVALRGRPCVTFTSDLRVRVQATGLTTYPDATVVCGRIEVDPEDKNTVTNPVVLVEVLSDSTETYDREDKRAHYRLIPSLREYVLVSQHERRIEHHHRNADGTWTLRDVRAGERARLDAVGCELAVDAVYDDPLAVATAPAAPEPGKPPRARARATRPARRKRA